MPASPASSVIRSQSCLQDETQRLSSQLSSLQSCTHDRNSEIEALSKMLQELKEQKGRKTPKVSKGTQDAPLPASLLLQRTGEHLQSLDGPQRMRACETQTHGRAFVLQAHSSLLTVVAAVVARARMWWRRA